jgi:hypothetical protein
MGSGYGPLTHQMASMGYRVTCADISEDLLDYVRTRCAGLPGPVETIRCDMNDFTATGVYDAIVFFESFHHVLDHAELLRRIGDCLADDGILVFAGEPIVPGDSDVVPYPWGLRMDGMSLWAIRRQGWLELGFRLDYFNEVLRRTGWTYRCVQSIASPGTDIWICRRALKNPGNAGNANEPLYVWHASDAVIMTQCGRRDPEQGTLQSQGQAGYLAYGPYKPLEAGTYEIIWKGALEGEVSTAVAEVACRAGQDVLREIAMTRDSGVLARTKFHLREAVVDMEFRVRVGAHDVIELRSIELRKID